MRECRVKCVRWDRGSEPDDFSVLDIMHTNTQYSLYYYTMLSTYYARITIFDTTLLPHPPIFGNKQPAEFFFALNCLNE